MVAIYYLFPSLRRVEYVIRVDKEFLMPVNGYMVTCHIHLQPPREGAREKKYLHFPLIAVVLPTVQNNGEYLLVFC